MKLSLGPIFSAIALAGISLSAADLKQSKFTQIVNEVKVLEMPAKKQKVASLNEVFKAPDILRTGPASRAELVADDRTITRVGANTIFSFDPANRTIGLEQGSVLFHAPKGKGGGTIRTTSAAASVLGTTIIVVATPNGGFKVLTLEGSSKVTLPNGQTLTLKAGQMTFVLPNNQGFSPVITFALEEQTRGSQLVQGFEVPLPSWNLIQQNIDRQNKLIFAGELSDTGLLVGDTATGEGIQVVDASVLPGQIFPHGEPPHEHPPVEPPPTVFDVIINATTPLLADDSRVTHIEPNVRHFISGNNMLIDQEMIDLAPYNHAPDFYFEPNNILRFEDNADHGIKFSGMSSGRLHLKATTFQFPNDFSLSFGGNEFYVEGRDSLTLSSSGSSGLRFENPLGRVTFLSPHDLTINGNVTLASHEGVSLQAGHDLIVHDAKIDTTLSSGAFLQEPAGISRYAFFDAGNTASLFGVSFTGVQLINVLADTVVLENITFPNGSFVYLTSLSGELAPNPNTGAAVVPGDINFIRNVFYGDSSTPAQNEISHGKGGSIFLQQRHPQETVTTTTALSSSSVSGGVKTSAGSLNLVNNVFKQQFKQSSSLPKAGFPLLSK